MPPRTGDVGAVAERHYGLAARAAVRATKSLATPQEESA
jgi:hypothetical protein